MKPIKELNISPWPWCGCYHEVLDADGCWVAKCAEGDVETMSNGNILRASPEMYEALSAMIHCAEKEAPYTDMSHMSIAMDMARKALAKAAGERK